MSQFGRYKNCQLLTKSNEAAIYWTYDDVLQRKLIIKTLRDDIELDAHHVDLQREAMITSQVNSDNVVNILDFMIEGDRPFIVMDYVDGIDLKVWLEKGNKLSLNKSLIFLLRLLETMISIHAKNIIHADIKPSNLILSNNQKNVTIIDFGIAQFGNDVAFDAKVAGSPHYMPPEQANAQKVTVQSDLYSIGLIWYELVTGKKLFSADSHDQLIKMICYEKLPDLTDFKKKTNPSCTDILGKLLEKNPQKRFKSARNLRSSLKAELKKTVRFRVSKLLFPVKNARKIRYIQSVLFGMALIFFLSFSRHAFPDFLILS